MKNIVKYIALTIIPFILYGSLNITNSLCFILVGITIYFLFNKAYLFIPSIFLYTNIEIIFFLLAIIIISFILRKFILKNKYISYLFLGILLIGDFLLLRGNLEKRILYFIPSLSIYFILLQYINIYFIDNTYTCKISNMKIFQSIFIILLGFSSFGLNYYLIILTILILYLSKLNHIIMLIFSIFIYVLQTIFITDLFPFTFLLLGIIYLLPKYYPLIISILLLFIDTFTINSLSNYQKIYILLALLLFEIFKIIKIDYNNKKYTSLNIYDNIINNFNDQVLKFASFLDEFERKFTSNREQKIKFMESYNYLINTYCTKCNNKEYCFVHNKNEAYLFLKNSLLYGHNLMIKRDSSLSLDFINNCPNHDNIINKSNILKNKFNLNKDKSQKEQALEHQLVGMSNTLRQYVIDISSKREMQLEILLSLKNSFIEIGYDILLFNVKKIFKDDFFIEIGLSNITHEELYNVVKKEAEKRLNHKISITIKKENDNSIYFYIVPYIAYNILYGEASIAKENQNITGDNYLIKDLDTGLFIAAISDGMGSGYKAYIESKETLEILDRITEFEINPSTSINMLNTFYSLKENMDQYATLDFIEINKSTGDAMLFKMGSSNTYLIRDANISVIYNQNLPFGINDLIIKNELVLKDKDCIILASDGIVDNICENDLKEVILLSLHKDPKEIALDIINKIISNKKKALDDMSIIVLKIEKKGI